MIATEELKKLKADKVVDARGTACPGPLLMKEQNQIFRNGAPNRAMSTLEQ
jgi:hypothetical protein